MRHASLLACVVVCLSGCVRSNFNLATQQQEYTITSTEKEVALGRRVAQQVHKELPDVADEPLQQRVRAIGERIVAVCDRKELVYRFSVVQDDAVNAFSLPGGYVFINEGLIKKTSNDDELAGVIAHEVAHITARHAVKHYESQLGLQAAQLVTLATRQGEAARGISVLTQATQLAYSRRDELEADQLAVKYVKAAGFQPKAILTFLEKLQNVHRDKTNYLPAGVVRPQYALTHPYVTDRLRAVKEALFGSADYMDYLNTPD